MQHHEALARLEPGLSIFNTLGIHQLGLRHSMIGINLPPVPTSGDGEKTDMRLTKGRVIMQLAQAVELVMAIDEAREEAIRRELARAAALEPEGD